MENIKYLFLDDDIKSEINREKNREEIEKLFEQVTPKIKSRLKKKTKIIIINDMQFKVEEDIDNASDKT